MAQLLAAHQPQSLAKAGAVLIAEGIALLSEASQDAPKLIETCRRKYPRLDDAISTHIPAPVRERARHLKRERAFASLQELYLEAILGSLIKRGFMSRSLEPTTGPQRGSSVSRPAVAASRVNHRQSRPLNATARAAPTPPSASPPDLIRPASQPSAFAGAG